MVPSSAVRESVRWGVSPGVHLGIQACGVVAVEELDRVVGASSVRVKGQIGQPWEQQRARGAR